ncbi:DUF2442 domain-containing protein [Allochromatium humboldtianum]|uniref:DUF2442 domain-containing protein n=1 Tax=Allochromatium humboldtianum TaxID=504901 RepID=A0A850R616_9GAMM|nr:DUF2442 domain-containing protein [Allochromatium humboldtianum]NVZ07836.1 DUF2442 domain-containing protein [Allochromatium humboldtianum]
MTFKCVEPVDPRADHIECTEDELVVRLVDGRIISVPLAWFPRLANAMPPERAQFELLGDGRGIHWPLLDEDISVQSLLIGKSRL